MPNSHPPRPSFYIHPQSYPQRACILWKLSECRKRPREGVPAWGVDGCEVISIFAFVVVCHCISQSLMCTTVIESCGKEREWGHNSHHAAKTIDRCSHDHRRNVPVSASISSIQFQKLSRSCNANIDQTTKQSRTSPLCSISNIQTSFFCLSGRTVMGCVVLCWEPSY